MEWQCCNRSVGRICRRIWAEKILRRLVDLAINTSSRVIHFVTDCYPAISIKNAERKHSRVPKSGSQKIRISKVDQPVPKQWKKYLANTYNKETLVKFLFDTWKKVDVAVLKGVSIVMAYCQEFTITVGWSRSRPRSPAAFKLHA